MSTQQPDRASTLSRRWDMQHETLRLQYKKLVESAEPLTFEAVMKLHRETFKAGAEAMADAIHIEQSEIVVEAAEEAARLEREGSIIRPDFWSPGKQTHLAKR